jgi:uncharacterized repeat protein (TIGR01451 family)
MISVIRQMKTVLGVAVLLSSLAQVQVAFAVGTDAGVTVGNRATVNYSVGTVAQAPIESSPTGNSTPGANNGEDTMFMVDNRIDLTVTELIGAATVVAPGQLDAVTAFTVTNTGNATEGFQLSASNLVGGTVFGNTDDTEVLNLLVFVDNPGAGGTANVYDAAFDTAIHIDSLDEGDSAVVFIVADVDSAATNGQFASVRLQAQAAAPGTNGATLEVEDATDPDTAGIDIVFGDAGEDATETADSQYEVQSASLTITKTSSIVRDPFNGTGAARKAIPGAVIEYEVEIANTGSVDAVSVRLSDTLDVSLAFTTGEYNAGASDVEIQVGAAPATYCVAEAGADSNTDGCNRAGQTLTVNPTASITVPAGQTATVRFRATIN